MSLNRKALKSAWIKSIAQILAGLGPDAPSGQGSGGTSTDTKGAVIPGATIEIGKTETDVVTTTETGVNGLWYMPNMPFGQFDVCAEPEGFKRAEARNLRLIVASEMQQSFAFEI